MKKSIMLLSLVLVGLLGVAQAATALSSVTPNVIAVTTASATTITAPYGSQWVVVPAQSVYINQLNSATPNTNYPILVSANTYDLTMNRGQRIVMLAGVNGNVTFVPKAAYISTR